MSLISTFHVWQRLPSGQFSMDKEFSWEDGTMNFIGVPKNDRNLKAAINSVPNEGFIKEKKKSMNQIGSQRREHVRSRT